MSLYVFSLIHLTCIAAVVLLCTCCVVTEAVCVVLSVLLLSVCCCMCCCLCCCCRVFKLANTPTPQAKACALNALRAHINH